MKVILFLIKAITQSLLTIKNSQIDQNNEKANNEVSYLLMKRDQN